MCFSAEVDLIAGTAVTLIGVDAVRHVGTRRDLALASLPIVLGVHLVVEAAVWHGLEGHDSFLDLRTATVAYLAIAFVVVPILAPVAVALREPPERGRQLVPFVALGAIAAAVLANAMWEGPIVAEIDGHHIAYEVPLTSGGLIVAAYVVAVCGPCLLSRDRGIRLFGVANLLAVALLVTFEKAALISLWCAWAAVTSALIAIHLRQRARSSRAATADSGRTAAGHGDRSDTTDLTAVGRRPIGRSSTDSPDPTGRAVGRER